MTQAEALQKATREIDALIDRGLDQDRDFLFTVGYPTDEEVAAFLDERRQFYARWRVEQLVKLERFLGEPDAKSVELH